VSAYNHFLVSFNCSTLTDGGAFTPSKAPRIKVYRRAVAVCVPAGHVRDGDAFGQVAFTVGQGNQNQGGVVDGVTLKIAPTSLSDFGNYLRRGAFLLPDQPLVHGLGQVGLRQNFIQAGVNDWGHILEVTVLAIISLKMPFLTW